MFVLNPLPPAVAASDLALLIQAEPAVIGHFRYAGFMMPRIRAHFQDRRVAGTAVTLRMPSMDGSIVHYAIGKARPGDILVIDRCGDTAIAAMGGAVAYAAKCAGVAGIIVDGAVTDLGELRQYGVPVWSSGTSAVTVKTLGLGGEFCIPVSCGDVAVNPGDAILADENGVLVLPPADVAAAAARAIQMQADEKVTLARLTAGEKYPDIMGTTDVINEWVARHGC
ncbi:Dimethylmenaquinone methyltransferase [Gluconacetobacter diazotrophicus PA1 5]|nr:RraA family protein [Gluconacetobacter diazotrophicus]ACI52017.1 Dimethylmenaquinone methyltransferase [Gluconacetobacter diazotrophicus PA1 5]MBB2157633.1 RraA family protein [Gluconacetobacter diazotrophicus]TWB05210.1 regulator of RNase E activity RraA [Gluconacetobacter diazotrophicus]